MRVATRRRTSLFIAAPPLRDRSAVPVSGRFARYHASSQTFSAKL